MPLTLSLGGGRYSMKEPFHKRFNIEVDIEEARRRFVNRANTLLFNLHEGHWSIDALLENQPILPRVVAALGEEYTGKPISYYIRGDFQRCLQAIEAYYEACSGWPGLQQRVNDLILELLERAEVELGVSWRNGAFYPSGAVELDEALVNEPLEWLEQQGYDSVAQPFRKGLKHFLQSGADSERLFDVITDVYEALEALAKIVTGRDKDLSANAELFVKRVKVSPKYKMLLKDYIAFANDFRHGVLNANKRPRISRAEVESFIYLTGLFIRLAMQTQTAT